LFPLLESININIDHESFSFQGFLDNIKLKLDSKSDKSKWDYVPTVSYINSGIYN